MKNLIARPDLGARLALLAGSQRRHIKYAHERLPAGSGSVEWVRKVVSGRAGCPIALAVNLIRIAEERPNLDRDEAWAMRDRYFEEV